MCLWEDDLESSGLARERRCNVFNAPQSCPRVDASVNGGGPESKKKRKTPLTFFRSPQKCLFWAINICRCACGCVCVCVWACERLSECASVCSRVAGHEKRRVSCFKHIRQSVIWVDFKYEPFSANQFSWKHFTSSWVCVCVCLCVRERDDFFTFA